MRIYLILIVTVFLKISYAQDYTLFNSNSKKLFTTYPIPFTTYSLAFDSAIVSGNDSTYYNFFNLNDTFVNSNCPWWGPTWCWKQNFPSWIGREIINVNNSNYIFFNNFNAPLQFDFNLNINDTLIFYSDSIQKFSYKLEKIDTIEILGVIDSAKFYKIIHTDILGNIINSVLNSELIRVSKNFGLISFFQIDSFPQLLKPIYLIGNVNPDAGFTALTNENLYDYQIGDEIQYQRTYYASAGPPSQNYNYYVKYTFLNKTVTADSILYSACRYLFHVDSTTAVNDTINLSYYKYDTIANVPIDKFNGWSQNLFLSDYCGLKLWTYRKVHFPYLGYCPVERCWGNIDTGGPAPQTTNTYVAGLGDYDLSTSLLAGPPPANNYGYHTEIVYFKKDSIICGSPVILNVAENNNLNDQINILPNPAKDYFKINAPFKIDEVVLLNALGKIIVTKRNLAEEAIDCANLSQGIYIVKIKLDTGYVISKKLIITKDTK